jgi:hypothetical protein
VYSFAIPANQLGTQNGVRLRLYGTYLNDDGTSRNLRVRIKFGGVTLWDDELGSIANSSATRGVFLDVQLFNAGTNATQRLGGLLSLSGPGNATTGSGGFNATSAGGLAALSASGTVSTTSAQTLEVTVQHNASDANLSFTRQWATLEFIQ